MGLNMHGESFKYIYGYGWWIRSIVIFQEKDGLLEINSGTKVQEVVREEQR